MLPVPPLLRCFHELVPGWSQWLASLLLFPDLPALSLIHMLYFASRDFSMHLPRTLNAAPSFCSHPWNHPFSSLHTLVLAVDIKTSEVLLLLVERDKTISTCNRGAIITMSTSSFKVQYPPLTSLKTFVLCVSNSEVLQGLRPRRNRQLTT